MNNLIPSRLAALRAVMDEKGIDAYLVPTEDFHGSEYVGDYFKCREYITGFTGSAGTAVITKEHAGLWTDGRYFLQASRQLEGTGVTLYKMGQPEVPTIHEYLEKTLTGGMTLGFDGRCVGAKEAEELQKKLSAKGVKLNGEYDLVGQVWETRPALSCRPVWEMDVRWCGVTRADKLAAVREKMLEKKADVLLLASLDDIAWLLNLRGDDVHCNPVFLSYLAVEKDSAVLFIQKEALSDEVKSSLAADGVSLSPYDGIYAYARELSSELTVMADKGKANSRLITSVMNTADGKERTFVDAPDPTLLMKAVKNETETENIRQAHVKDGVALTRFIYWLKNNVGKERMTELSAAEKLYEFRSSQEGFLGNSFDPIIAYDANASVIHYSPTAESDTEVQPHGFLLADTGGQYLDGTTDVTRTIVMGPVTDEEKKYFTAVLRGHLALANAKFLYGCRGMNLDYLARGPLWALGVDYNHGTGHGVGYVLNVHEGPNGFRWKVVPERNDSAVFEEGMVTSDEPGYYVDGKFGIRHENLILCRKDEKTEYGQFMRFEYLTMAPFDLDAVVPEQMSPEEREMLNAYHRQVFETVSPFLPPEEAAWLKEATREI